MTTTHGSAIGRPRPALRFAATCVSALGLTAGSLALTSAESASAASFVVDTLSDNPADGNTLREAVADANASAGPDTIEFASGVAGTITLTGGELSITDSVTISGPGADSLTLAPDLSGRVFGVSGATDFVVSGVTIADGVVLGSGGGVTFTGNDLTVSDVVFTDNQASNQGGALWAVPQGDVTIERTSFVNNRSGQSGGALFIDEGTQAGTVRLDAVDATDNEAVNSNGGGIFVSTSQRDVFVSASNVESNTATNASAGGAWLDGRSVNVQNSSFVDNTAGMNFGGATINSNAADIIVLNTEFIGNTGDSAGGASISSAGGVNMFGLTVEDNSSTGTGGLTLSGPSTASIGRSSFTGNSGFSAGALSASMFTTFVMLDSTVQGNAARAHGGIATDGVDSVRTTRSTFTNNRSTDVFGNGGAIYARNGATLQIDSSTIHANQAINGGGVYADNIDVELSGSTVTDNAAMTEGGGIFVDSADLSVDLSILIDNTAPTHNDTNDTNLDIDYSIMGSALSTIINGDNNLFNVDPELGPLQDNGGATHTRLPSATSPALDGGTSGGVLVLARRDQRGRERQLPFDIGSVEAYDGDDHIWVPVTPQRFVDTRDTGVTVDGDNEATGAFDVTEQRTIAIAGRGDVPADAVGVVANVTAVQPSAKGFFTAHPCVEPRPVTASLNYTEGINLGNEVIVGLDAAGAMCLYTAVEAHVTIDVVGYIPVDSAYQPSEPARVLDTRPGNTTIDGVAAAGGKLAAESFIELPVANRAGVAAAPTAVALYVTAVAPESTGFVTVWDCDGERPNSSALNYVAGVNRGNEVIVTPNSAGNICLYSFGAAHLTADVVGSVNTDDDFFLGSGFPGTGSGLTTFDAARRMLDTRATGVTIDGLEQATGKLDGGDAHELPLAGRAGIPEEVTTVIMNVTAVAPEGAGFVTVYDCNDLPLASSLNYVPGVNGGNEIVASVNGDGDVCLYTAQAAHLTVDVVGYTSR